MSQDRLNGLDNLSIEKEMLKNIDVDVIINNFASQKLKKTTFDFTRNKEVFFWISCETIVYS